MKLQLRLSILFSILCSILAISGCGGGGGSTASGPAGTLQMVSSSPTPYSAGQSGTVTLQYTSPNTYVTLRSSDSVLVKLNSTLVKTDVNGIATVPYAVGTSVDDVTVTVFATVGDLTVRQDVRIKGTSSPGQGMTIPKLDNSSLQPGSSTNVTVYLSDTKGLPAKNTPVTFETTLGTLNPGSGIVTTDQSGKATISLLAGTVTGGGVLTASATIDGVKNVKSVTFSVETSTSPKLTVSAGASGYTVWVVARYADPTTTNWSGHAIQFSSPDHPEIASAATVLTASDGYATMIYDASALPSGTSISFVASSAGLSATTSATVFQPISKASMTLSASVSGTQITVVAKYTDPDGFLAGVPITFSCDYPIVVPGSTKFTDSTGTATYIINLASPPTIKTINITATTDNSHGSLTKTAPLTLTPSAPTLTLTAAVSGTQITVTAKYADTGAISLYQVPITLTCDQGALVGYPAGREVTTDASGTAVAVYYLSTLPTISAVNFVATTGSLTATVAAPLVASKPSLTLTTAVSASQVAVTAKYADPADTSLDGVVVSIFSDQPGIVGAPQTVTTDVSGNALAIFTVTGSVTAPIINFTATTGSLTALAKTDLTLPTMTLSLSSATPNVGAVLIATAKYSSPHSVTLAGIPVTFTTDASAVFDSVTVTTDASGTASAAMLVKGGSGTKVNVSAAGGSATASPQVLTVQTPTKPTLSITPPGAGSGSVAVPHTNAGIFTFVPAGVFAVLTNNGVPLQGEPVTLKVETIINSVDHPSDPALRDKVVFWSNYPSQPASTPSITLVTDSSGQIVNQSTVEVWFPNNTSEVALNKVITVVWKVSYGSGVDEVFGYATTQYTVSY